jgi:hypothetical protein
MKKPGKHTRLKPVHVTGAMEYRPKITENSRTFEVGAYRFEKFEHGDQRLVGVGVKSNFISVAVLEDEDVQRLTEWMKL